VVFRGIGVGISVFNYNDLTFMNVGTKLHYDRAPLWIRNWNIIFVTKKDYQTKPKTFLRHIEARVFIISSLVNDSHIPTKMKYIFSIKCHTSCFHVCHILY